VKNDDIFVELRRIDWKLNLLINAERIQMASLNDIVDAVNGTQGTVDSVVTLLGQLHQELVDALAANDPAAVQAVVDQIDAQKQQLADAVANNPDPNAQPAPEPTP
jgi:DNA-binding FadR family transcriptional regulator